MSAHDRAATMTRRSLLRAGALAGLAALLPTRAAAAASQCGPWPLWNAFVDKHIQPDGRVVDFLNPDQRSTSEGQSYALFFALVNNDQVLFEKVLGWTRHNLCGGRPDLNLPAWLWGAMAAAAGACSMPIPPAMASCGLPTRCWKPAGCGAGPGTSRPASRSCN